ncbi:MAG: ABC transporter permease [Clostridia bacterium]|nr:ABC transporter permease [Clostridia bacterium]MDH7572908.1 ABC transporter permease [Clostridia bacterium]
MGNRLQLGLGLLWVLLAWEVLSLALNHPALPGPLVALADLIRHAGRLWPHFWYSFYRVVLSLLVGLVTAAPLGLAVGRKETLDRLLMPAAYLLYPVPKIAFLPLVFLLLGIGDGARIFLVTTIIFFQILVASRDAARGIPQQSILSMLSLGARPGQVFRHIILPACLPGILSALRVSLGTAISVLFFTETVAGTTGLGYYIFDSMYRADYPQMLAGIVAIGLLGLMLFAFIDWLERRLCAWQYVV